MDLNKFNLNDEYELGMGMENYLNQVDVDKKIDSLNNLYTKLDSIDKQIKK